MAERHFESGGEDYARHRPVYPAGLVDALAGACAGTEHALDVGCGTGQLSVLLAERFARVTALDPSETQIDNATPHPRVRYSVEPAEMTSLPDGSVDLVVAAQAAHWLALDEFYAEARRVGRAGARLALVSYGVPALDGPPGDALRRFYWEEIHRFWPARRRLVEEGYRSLPFPFEEEDIALPPMERGWSLAELLGYAGTWSAVKRARAAGEGRCFDAFAEALRETWGPPDTPRAVRWPLVVRLGALPSPGAAPA